MRLRETLKIALPFTWFGAVCAISFMEAPLKFGAPNLTTPVALEVGHIVFDALNKAEWGICIILGISLFSTSPSRLEISAFILVLIVLLSQTFWLFPMKSMTGWFTGLSTLVCPVCPVCATGPFCWAVLARIMR